MTADEGTCYRSTVRVKTEKNKQTNRTNLASSNRFALHNGRSESTNGDACDVNDAFSTARVCIFRCEGDAHTHAHPPNQFQRIYWFFSTLCFSLRTGLLLSNHPRGCPNNSTASTCARYQNRYIPIASCALQCRTCFGLDLSTGQRCNDDFAAIANRLVDRELNKYVKYRIVISDQIDYLCFFCDSIIFFRKMPGSFQESAIAHNAIFLIIDDWSAKQQCKNERLKRRP